MLRSSRFKNIFCLYLIICRVLHIESKQNYCTRNRASDSVYGQARLDLLKLERSGYNFSQELDARGEIDLPVFLSKNGKLPQKMGKCAVVGLGESLLHQSLGSQIDAYDSVIRFGWQPSFLPSVLGSKSTYVLIRKRPYRTYKDSGGDKCDLRFDRWNTLPAYTTEKFLMPDTGIFYFSECSEDENTDSFLPDFPKWRVRPALGGTVFNGLVPFLKGNKSQRQPKPTSGAVFIFTLFKSQMCRSIDLFGFGHRKYSGHIYEKIKRSELNSHRTLNKCMKFVHCLDCENLLYRSLSYVRIN